jgi:hypothetical protein
MCFLACAIFVQERCAEAHATLLDVSPRYFTVEDRSQELRETPGCSAAGELDCFLLRMSERRDMSKGDDEPDCNVYEGL